MRRDPTKDRPGTWDSSDSLEDLNESYDFDIEEIDHSFAYKNLVQNINSMDLDDETMYRIAFAYESQKDAAAALMKELHASVMRHGRFPRITNSTDEEALLNFAVADKSIRVVKNQKNRKKIVSNLDHAPFREAVLEKLTLRWPDVNKHL